MNRLGETHLFQSLSQLAQAQTRLDALRKTLLRALKHKFGSIPIELVQIIAIHPEPERLEQLIAFAFDAPDIDTFQLRLSSGTLMDQLIESHLFRQLTEEQLNQLMGAGGPMYELTASRIFSKAGAKVTSGVLNYFLLNRLGKFACRLLRPVA